MKAVRCAIYTRKSSEEGLEQGFNSLHAQRDACAAYILSQASEGWTLVSDAYDDGGISGGTLERPGLQRLLADISAGRIDIVVVYKVDRLTRSLLDFAKLVEAFDAAGVSFVSITQAFNTTTSMGRLTLNMLLSFAQFEREVTAERIRDKIAASKAKGMWMGGTPPLGYKAAGRTLAIVEDHANLVRTIFERYLELGNVRSVTEALESQGIRSPARARRTGATFGDRLFTRGQIYQMLRNPIYTGRIAHRDRTYPGQHPAIIDPDIWEQTQAQLSAHIQGTRSVRRPNRSLLAGKIVDGAGEPLIAVHSCKNKVRYRYYVSRSLQTGDADKEGRGIRVPARQIERAVSDTVAALFDDPVALLARAWLDVPLAGMAHLISRCASISSALKACNAVSPITDFVAQVRVLDREIEIDVAVGEISDRLAVAHASNGAARVTIRCAAAFRRTGGCVRLVQASGRPVTPSEPSVPLIKLIVQARQWWAILAQGEVAIGALAKREGVTSSWMTRVVRLAFLAPAVVEAVLDGGQPASVNSKTMVATDAVPALWREQIERYH